MKIDPNWKPSRSNLLMGRGIGTTTQMMLYGLDIALSGRNVIFLLPNYDVAEWSYHHFMAIQQANFPDQFHLEEPPGYLHHEPARRGPRLIQSDEGQRIGFLPVSMRPDGWKVGGAPYVKILFDHTVDRWDGLDTNHVELWRKAAHETDKLQAQADGKV
jgi:hypothetical protein